MSAASIKDKALFVASVAAAIVAIYMVNAKVGIPVIGGMLPGATK